MRLNDTQLKNVLSKEMQELFWAWQRAKSRPEHGYYRDYQKRRWALENRASILGVINKGVGK